MLFADDLALLEKRGTGVVDDGAKPRILHCEQGVVLSGTRGGDGRWSRRRVGYVCKGVKVGMNVGLVTV